MNAQSKAETQEDNLERAVDFILEMEPKFDILTLNKAIAVILERRARKPAWKEWFCNNLQDAERKRLDDMHPLEPDLV